MRAAPVFRRPRASHGAMSDAADPFAEDCQYWRDLCPDLPITDGALSAEACRAQAAPPSDAARRLVEEGFFLASKAECAVPEELLAQVASAVERVVARGWPASFAMLYDAVWQASHIVAPLLAQPSRGLLVPNFDVLAWKVVASEGQSGFSPHRDRQPLDVASSFAADGTPKYATIWLALSAATPQNSCLYVVPRRSDPGYLAGDGPEDPLRRALADKAAYQAIRALPRCAGEAVVFSHRILHWGSAGDAGEAAPRLAISFAHSARDFEAPYLTCEGAPAPRQRLALAAAQMLEYFERFSPSPREIQQYLGAFERCKAFFDAAYARKVMANMAGAVKSAAGAAAAPRKRPRTDGGAAEAAEAAEAAAAGEEGEEDGEDALDRALEAVLDARMAGDDHRECRDDFDEMDEALAAEEERFIAAADGEEDEEDEEEEEPAPRIFSRNQRQALE